MVNVAADHLQCAVAEYVLQAEDIAALVDQIVGGVGMAAKMGVQSRYISGMPPPMQDELNRIVGQSHAFEIERGESDVKASNYSSR
jgi:hypothetical protein